MDKLEIFFSDFSACFGITIHVTGSHSYTCFNQEVFRVLLNTYCMDLLFDAGIFTPFMAAKFLFFINFSYYCSFMVVWGFGVGVLYWVFGVGVFI